nr:hypothetical protein TetV2_00622 [Oceanusvirus sp.]
MARSVLFGVILILLSSASAVDAWNWPWSSKPTDALAIADSDSIQPPTEVSSDLKLLTDEFVPLISSGLSSNAITLRAAAIKYAEEGIVTANQALDKSYRDKVATQQREKHIKNWNFLKNMKPFEVDSYLLTRLDLDIQGHDASHIRTIQTELVHTLQTGMVVHFKNLILLNTKNLGDQVDSLSNQVGSVGKNLGDQVDSLSNQVASVGKNLGDQVDSLSNQVGSVGKNLGDQVDSLSNQVGSVGKNLGDQVDSLSNQVGSVGKNLGDQIGSVEKNLGDQVETLGNNVDEVLTTVVHILTTGKYLFGITCGLAALCMSIMVYNSDIKTNAGLIVISALINCFILASQITVIPLGFKHVKSCDELVLLVVSVTCGVALLHLSVSELYQKATKPKILSTVTDPGIMAMVRAHHMHPIHHSTLPVLPAESNASSTVAQKCTAEEEITSSPKRAIRVSRRRAGLPPKHI